MCKPSVKTILLLISVLQTVDSNVWIQCTTLTLSAQHIKSYLFRWKNNNMWYHENISRFKKNYKKSQHCSVAQVTLSCKNKCLCHLSRRIQKQILKRRKWDVLFNLTQSLNINQAIMTPPLGGIVTHEEKWLSSSSWTSVAPFKVGQSLSFSTIPKVFREIRGSPSDHLSYSAVCFPA